MAATRSALQHSVFQTDDERLLGFVNISSVNDKRKKKETFLCVTASTQQPIIVKLYFIRAKDDGFYKKDSFMLRDVKMIDGINPRKPSTTFHIYIGDKKQVFNAATLEEKEAFVQELYLLSEKYLPVQKPEFVNISIPIVDTTPKTADYTDDRHATTEDNYQPITLREEMDFVHMLNEFNIGISDASIFHEKLTRRLQELDNTNIESIMTSEQAVTKLIEDLDKCEERMRFLSDRLQEYDDVLNQVEESIETIEEKAKLEATERENMSKLLAELEDFTRLVTQISPEHLELLQRPKLTEQASINQTAEAVRRSCNFLATETPHSQLQVYKERTQLVRDALSRFMDNFYSYLAALMNKMRNQVPLDNVQMMPKHSAVYRQFQMFSDIIHLVKENKPVVYQRFLDSYQQNAAAIFTQDIQVFYENMRQEMQNRPVNSIQDLQEIGRLLEIVLGESNTVVEAEQKFLSKCMHISPVDKRTDPPQLSDQMRNALKPIFEQLPQSFQTFSRSCASKGHLVVATLFVRLVSLREKYTDSASYFSVLLGNFIVGMKQVFDEQMNATMDSYRTYKISKKHRIGVLPIIDDFKQLMLACDQIFEKSERRNELEKWAVKLCHTIIETIDLAASTSNPKYPATLVRFENFHNLHLTLLELRKLESLESTRNSVKKKYTENQRYYVYDQLGRPLEKLHIFFESIDNAIKSGIRPEEVHFQQQFSRKTLKDVIAEYPGNEVRKNLENLYAKVEKHLGRDSPLLQVVWHNMQEDFLNQLKNYQAIIGRCYPNSRINLEFSIEDVLGYFSLIAQRH